MLKQRSNKYFFLTNHSILYSNEIKSTFTNETFISFDVNVLLFIISNFSYIFTKHKLHLITLINLQFNVLSLIDWNYSITLISIDYKGEYQNGLNKCNEK